MLHALDQREDEIFRGAADQAKPEADSPRCSAVHGEQPRFPPHGLGHLPQKLTVGKDIDGADIEKSVPAGRILDRVSQKGEHVGQSHRLSQRIGTLRTENQRRTLNDGTEHFV